MGSSEPEQVVVQELFVTKDDKKRLLDAADYFDGSDGDSYHGLAAEALRSIVKIMDASMPFAKVFQAEEAEKRFDEIIQQKI